MRTRNYKMHIDNWLLSGLAIGMILLFGALLTESFGLGPPPCPPCWSGPNCSRYNCNGPDCGCPGAPPGWFCCPGGDCAPPNYICCGPYSCLPTDTCCDEKGCCGQGSYCCGDGSARCCPDGYTCHGAWTCCPNGWSYCPGSPYPWTNCCPPDYHCGGSGFCCPKKTNHCGNGNCCYPEYCESCINGQCQPCGGDPYKSCCDGECYDTRTQKCCWYPVVQYNYICDINETCCNRHCCDPKKCESCFFDIDCVVCDGDPTLTCRNGHCCCAANGCGPCGGPAVPNNPAGCDDTSFLGPCNAHDDCYGECGNNKGTCDSNFLDAMLEICTGSSCGLPCFEAARAYYGAVDLGGQGAFDASQACSCG